MILIPDPNDLAWRTSSYTDRNDCVEVADYSGGAAIRDSKHPDEGHLSFNSQEWRAFLADLRQRAL